MSIKKIHRRLGIPDDYGSEPFLPLFDEAQQLVCAGDDVFGRSQQLSPQANNQWQLMRVAANKDQVKIALISCFRSYVYQAHLIEKKLAKGQSIADILKVNAAPGYSEHHTGNAMDIACAEAEPLSEDFENTAAFAWLKQHGSEFGFYLSYPKANRFGFIYEPWHWCYKTETEV